ncbi:hypothetical protein J3R03_000586 [Actinoplanes couchii]|uniref:DUF4253 domain-containing protein n=1 Tax=Actinoplanes couchii TaxID=403638 RepID=A0ABQ3X0M0_9ACTN|nr:hypothetical protein [Actinoplanes couchii]GID52004.1 hypothetical protein Aco03nite_004080 [Actinoplanes couchii]
MRLEHLDGNDRAARFYAAHGFTELCREPSEQPDWPDTVWLERSGLPAARDLSATSPAAPGLPATSPAVVDLPATETLCVTPGGVEIAGFRSQGDEALRWWERLRQAYPESGLWPLILETDTPGLIAETDPYDTLADALAAAETLDGAALLADYGARRLTGDSEYAVGVRAELAGEGAWPEDPEQPGFGLPYSWGRPEPVLVALVPAAEPWLVPVTLQFEGWNGYPGPAAHAAIMRYWYQRYGAEPVIMSGETLQYAVARPPATRADALALAWEYRQYNDGEYDLYHADTLTDLAGGLLNAPVWRMWWD